MEMIRDLSRTIKAGISALSMLRCLNVVTSHEALARAFAEGTERKCRFVLGSEGRVLEGWGRVGERC